MNPMTGIQQLKINVDQKEQEAIGEGERGYTTYILTFVRGKSAKHNPSRKFLQFSPSETTGSAIIDLILIRENLVKEVEETGDTEGNDYVILELWILRETKKVVESIYWI